MAELAHQSPVENLTLWERVYDYLRGEILDGRLEPGTELAEMALSEQLGVSRGPLREAIGRLAAEGLVTVRPRRGAVVRSLSEEEFLELYQVREALETMAVKLATPRLAADDLRRLADLNAAMDAYGVQGDVERFFEANQAFHARFLELSGNGKLYAMHQQLIDQLGHYRMRSLMLRGNLRRSVSEHAAILRAAKRGDGDRAAELMAEHIRVPQQRLQHSSKGAEAT
jgi:DNA-binding GntR family transcriptional regulator